MPKKLALPALDKPLKDPMPTTAPGFAVTDKNGVIYLWTIRSTADSAEQAYDSVLGQHAYRKARDNRGFAIRPIVIQLVPMLARN